MEEILGGVGQEMFTKVFFLEFVIKGKSNSCRDVEHLDQFRFLGNCPLTPPLSQLFALSEK